VAEERRVTKVQELLYELTVSDVMKEEVYSIPANTRMSEVREILRSKHISGAPVVEGDKLVGIISLQDFIDWLAEGQPDYPISEKMTKDVKALFVNEPLVNVIDKFDKYGFGRFPVITHREDRLVGILTKGTVVEGLLAKLAIIRREEEEMRYRSNPIFDEISADRFDINLQYHIVANDFDRAGRSASGLKKTLNYINIHPRIVRRVAVATYEAEMNIVIYSDGGEITAKLEPEQIEIVAYDNGPGIKDIEKAMQPGYSTAPSWIREMGFGAGMGLSNIERCTDDMDLTSSEGGGTHLKMCFKI
jgi:CBS domain-containing protein/anti-sigma regulatory factor (Ser/Thr protein kinase)